MIYKQRNIILKSTIPSDLFFKLKERINKKSKSFTKELAGNIVREEDLEDSEEEYEEHPRDCVDGCICACNKKEGGE